MTTLYSHFVNYYTSIAASLKARRHYENSWINVDRTDEVGAIRSFLLDSNVGVDYINQKIAKPLSKANFHVKFASIFCHKKPRIKRTQKNKLKNKGDTPGCELGDLFVAFILLDSNDKLHYSAGALFQAKLRPKLNSLTQQCLYDFDDDYDVPSYLADRLNPANRNRLMPTYDEGRGRAFRYLILEPDHTEERVTARHTPWPNNFQKRWSSFLDGLICGSDGLRTDLTTKNPSSWDIIVADLLSIGLNVPRKKPPRGNNVATQVATSLFNNFSNLDNYFEKLEDKHEGVPTLLIIAHAHEMCGD